MRKQTTKTDIRKALRAVEVILLRRDVGAGMLWNILTALRGPDQGMGKPATVGVRRAAFPSIARWIDRNGYGYANGASFLAKQLEHSYAPTPVHFTAHVRDAQTALTRLATPGRLA